MQWPGLQGVLLLAVGTVLCSFGSGQDCSIPGCVDGEASPNQRRCFHWSQSPNGDCTIDDGQPVSLFFSTGLEMLFVYQDGHHAGYYIDNLLCVWNIDPEDPCKVVTYTHILKDFHADDPTDGTNCRCKDHTEILFGPDLSQDHLLCGDSNANQCPITNCLQFAESLVSNGPMQIKFRSDSDGYGMGFFGLVSLATIRDCGQGSRRKRQEGTVPPQEGSGTTEYVPFRFGQIEVPITPLCQEMECACNGMCTVENVGDGVRFMTTDEKQAAADIVYDKEGLTAYAYANSPDLYLLRVARTAIRNLEIYNTTLPSQSLMLERELCPSRF